MQWRGRRASGNVQDRRSMGGKGIAGGGVGAIIVVLALMYMGVDPRMLVESGVIQQGPVIQQPASPEEEDLVEYMKVVLADTEDVWSAIFQQQGRDYPEPTLVLFRDSVDSACGHASSAVGPFYCSLDQDIYLDLQFFDELHQRFGAPGDFAQAYVIAHEVGHHVQRVTGVSDKVHAQQQRLDELESNHLSVRLELQADYLAGVWGHHIQKMKKVLDLSDAEEALRAASAIGDDRLQRESQGSVVPDSFTHGTSEQRLRWFKRGFESGDFGGANALFDLDYAKL